MVTFFIFFLLSGCTTFTHDAGFDDVSAFVRHRSDQTPVYLRSEEEVLQQRLIIQDLLGATLLPEDAVCIALINNTSLQASLTELGMAEASLVQAGKMRNPSLSYLKLTPVVDEYDLESKIIFDIMSLFTIPLRTAIEKRNFEQAKVQAAIDILELSEKTRKAYYNAIAAKQMLHYLEKIKETAKISANLAKDLKKSGNFSKLQHSREQAFYLEIVAQEKQAKIAALKAHEHLNRLLGFSEDFCFILPERLPDLPDAIQEREEIEKMGLNNRLDIQLMKYELESKAKALKLTKATRFINVFDLGYAYNSSHSIPHQNGYEIDFEIPLFDWGEAKVAKARSIYMQSVWRLRNVVINACSEIRETYQIYQMTFDLAKHYRDNVIPLRKQILDEDLLRYNGMLISTFELMADEREQIVSVNAYIEALRNFWIAQIDMQTALMVKSPLRVS